MNTPNSREGNLIRFVVYCIAYVMAVGVVELVSQKTPLRVWDLILYALVTAMVLLFYVYRFNREQRFFERVATLPVLGDFGLTVGLTLATIASRILVMYFQTLGKVPSYGFQASFVKHESTGLFWFLMLAEGIVLPILQQYLTIGFLFNYLFRDNIRTVALIGIVCSGILFSLLNFQHSLILLVIEAAYGMFFAWSYMYTQTLRMPIYLAILSGVLTVVMM